MIHNLVFKKNDDVVTREIAGEVILIPLFHSSDDLNYIYTLNETSARFWGLVDGKATVRDLCGRLLEEYEVAEEILDRNIEELVKDLEAIGALIRAEVVPA